MGGVGVGDSGRWVSGGDSGRWGGVGVGKTRRQGGWTVEGGGWRVESGEWTVGSAEKRVRLTARVFASVHRRICNADDAHSSATHNTPSNPVQRIANTFIHSHTHALTKKHLPS